MQTLSGLADRRHNNIAIGTLVALAASMFPRVAEAGEVGVNIRVDEAFVELVRGVRRAKGIDPPDSAADRRLRETLEQLRSRSRDAPSADAALHVAPVAVSPHVPMMNY